MDSASLAFQSSHESSALSIDAIVNHDAVSLVDHLNHLDMVHADVTKRHEDKFHLLLSSVLSCMPSSVCHAIQQAVDFRITGWLKILPLVHHHFDLSAQQFHDALCLHYHCPLSLMHASCDGCGEDSCS